MANVEHSALTTTDLHEPKDVAAATDKHVYVADGSASGDWTLPYELIGIFEEQQTLGTDGGTFTSGADRTRTINTEVYDKHSTLAVSSNQITITPNGSQSFVIEWDAPAIDIAGHQSFLYQTSGTPAEIARGTSEWSDTSDFVASRSVGMTVVTISVATTYEIRHRCNTTKTAVGFGIAGDFGTEVYTRVRIYRTG